MKTSAAEPSEEGVLPLCRAHIISKLGHRHTEIRTARNGRDRPISPLQFRLPDLV